MNNKFDLEKALRILKSKKITKGEVAKTTGYESTYLSKMISGERPVSEQFINIFMKEYGSHLNNEELILDDPMKELIKTNMRLEAKFDTMALIVSAVMDILTPDQKNKVAKVLNKGDFEENESFNVYNEAAKKRAEARLRKSQQEESD